MNFRLAPQAIRDVESIADYIDERNPGAATRLVDEFIRRWVLLATQPYSGTPRDDILEGIRHVVVSQYLAFYRIDDRQVVILRVLHGKRNITADDIEY